MGRRGPACRRCRGRHLKCNGERPCAQCKKSDIECDLSRVNVRFRSHKPRPKPDLTFSPSQEWVRTAGKGEFQYVDVSREYAQNDSSKSNARQTSISSKGPETTSPSSSHPGDAHDNGHSPISEAGPVFSSPGPLFTPDSTGTVSPQSISHCAVIPFSSIGYNHNPPEQSAYPHQRDKYPIGPLKGLPDSASNQAFVTNIEEACLMRHFVDDLAPWFDTSDRDHNFCYTVPERAMFCPVLRYAILTASAGHLTQSCSPYRNANNVIVYDGIHLPDLRYDTAISYHDICISYLIQMSNDPSGDFNENILTAATILRFFEQLDAPSAGTDTGTYLTAVQFIINTQRDQSFYAYRTIAGPPRDLSVHDIPAPSLGHSACLIALRQEIWSACLHQHPCRLPICPYEADIVFDDTASDFIWANRILIWCASLLNFCFRSEPTTHEEGVQRWTKFKNFEEKWQRHKPHAFRPIYHEDPAPDSGIFFPRIWHINSCQVMAEQHIELARILLAVLDPTISRIGLGASSANATLEAELRSVTRRLVGLGVSNPKMPPALVTSAVGISMCGEYFTDPREQEALVDVLMGLEIEHAWPTEATIAALRIAWASRAHN
ncbi:hypothetical protein SI65_02374 [Aspergillus cristatus]|uniref:Zn(2)-C6 fungal-type domain-containing protein n=1 Tax=Aspergillus cristatus TaxID=573508 RepID=A0A1E3BKP6_ASPCR|nr:hypothetical protein SI65_02374 [Aspergillus cristatus]